MYNCTKCDRRIWLNYGNDDQPICKMCVDDDKKKETPERNKCARCGKSCYKTVCYQCNLLISYKEKRAPDARTCITCGHILRTQFEEIKQCSRNTCMGREKYNSLRQKLRRLKSP